MECNALAKLRAEILSRCLSNLDKLLGSDDFLAEAESIHRADADADPAADARRGGIVEHLLFERVAHHINSYLAIARAFHTADALVVRDDLEFADSELGVRRAEEVH